MLPYVYIDEFGVGETLTLKPTDVFGGDPHWPISCPAQTLSCSPEPMGRKSGDTASAKVASRELLGFHLWSLPRSCLDAHAPLPLPCHREQEFVLLWGTEKERPHFILVERDALSSDLPLLGDRSLDPALHSKLWPWRVLLVSSWCSAFPEAGGSWREKPGMGKGLLVETGRAGFLL